MKIDVRASSVLRWIPRCLTLFAICASAAFAHGQFTLVKISSDSFTNSASQHKTEVEPDTYSWGSTMMAAFQVARIFGGGGADLGFSISTDGGKTWTQGYLPGLTENYKGGTFSAASDASVVYCAKYGVWLISSLPIESSGGDDVAVSRSSDGIHWGKLIMVDTTGLDDKNWITCDNNAKSPYYGNCYVEWDQVDGSGDVLISTSTDGGQTWSAGKGSSDGAQGLGGEPIVQPNGRLVVPFLSFGDGIEAFSSTNGGKSFSSTTLISQANVFQDDSGLRSSGLPLPSSGIDGGGKLYVAWSDCSFRKNCSSNDIVFSTSLNGSTWAKPQRIPIDPLTSTVDHFIPGLGVDRSTSFATAHLTSTYYYFPDAGCTQSGCKLNVGFTTSTDGGKHWTQGQKLAGPMEISWLPSTFSGNMVADYLSTSYVNGNPFGVFVVAEKPVDGVFKQAAYTTAEPLLVAADEPRFSSRGEKQVSHGKTHFEFRDVERESERENEPPRSQKK
ncbi:MAG TPA: sialidase family protein [Terriglobales bacterium]